MDRSSIIPVNWHSIKTRLVLALLALFGAAILLQLNYIAPKFEKRKIEEIKVYQKAFAEYLTQDISAKLDTAIKELEAAAQLPRLLSLDKMAMDEVIRTLNASNQFFNYYFVMDQEGKWLSYPTRPELVGKKIPGENMNWVKATFETGNTVFLDVVKSRVGTLVSGFSTPIRNRRGDIVALLRGVFVVSEKNVLIQSITKAGMGRGIQSYLVTSNGWLLAHSHQELNYREFNSYSIADLAPVRRVLKGQTGIIRYTYGGKTWIAVHNPIYSTRWGLIVHQPLEDIIAEAKSEARLMTYIIMSCLSVGLFIAALFVRKAIQPLFRLVREIQSGATGKADNYPRDEIGQLAAQYNRLYSELYQSNELIRRSESKFRTLFNNASDAIFIHDFDGRLIEANQKAVDYTGYDRDTLLKMNVTDIDAHESAALVSSRINALRRDGRLIFEAVHKTRSGDRIPVEISSRAIAFDHQNVILSVVRDLTERKKSEKTLRESHQRFLTVLDGIDATIYVADMYTYEILFMNKHMIESFGKDMTGEKCWHAFRNSSGPCSYCTNARLLDAQGKPTGVCTWQGENPITGKWYINYDRAIKWIDGRWVRLQVATDISGIKALEKEKRQFEEKLQQAQKMESLGTLAGGIAHDFNNLLMGIQGRASLATSELGPSHPQREHIEAIEEYIKSATNLTKQLLGFARGGKYDVKPIDINQLVLDTSVMFGRTRKEIRIHKHMHSAPLIVEADKPQIEQVLLNIFVNAWQAMPDSGDLFLKTFIARLDATVGNVPHVEAGHYAQISITDTGIGMADTVRQRVFDPFFTTKDKERGTGLGLASAYGIIKSHGGLITVHSEVGHGTTFDIYLPLSDKEIPPEDTTDEKLIQGSETILLVDDEAMIITVGAAMLKKLGYRVLTAQGGQKAIERVQKEGDNIDLIILDLIMPLMDGARVFDRIRQIQSDMPVLLSSGYSINGQAMEIMNRGCNGFIQKPFNMPELSQKIRKILDEIKNAPAG